MLDLLQKDCLENILEHLLNDVYIKKWQDVIPFKRYEWNELKDPSHFSKAFHYNCNRIEFFDIQTILKIAKGYTQEGISLPNGVKSYSRNYLKNCNDRLLDWKIKKKIQLPEAELILQQKWKPSPYFISVMFMNVCKNTRENLNTREYWNIRYSNDYRRGLRYIRVPIDIKMKYVQKVKETILTRYSYLLENITVECERYDDKIKKEIENRNILLDLLKEQIDTDNQYSTDIEELPYNISLMISPIYLSNIEMNASNPYHLTLQSVVIRIEKHQNNIDSGSLHYKKLIVLKRRIESLFKKHDI
jgi:hypothetical protein